MSLLPGGTATALTVVAADTARLRFVRGSAERSPKPRLLGFGEAALGPGPRELARAAKALRIPRAGPRATLLGERDYDIHILEAPPVPAAELKLAMKWKLKEVIDYPVEEAGYDILDMPADGRGSAQARNVFAITAKRAVLRACVARLDGAGLAVSVIDIPETAQRNVATLYEEQNRGVALLYLDDAGGLLTLSSGAELYVARRFDISLEQMRRAEGEARTDVFNRVLLELQRTLDNFERQFSSVAIAKLMLGPEPEDLGLLDYLQANLGIRVEALDLRKVLEAPPGAPLDPPSQWRLFHLIGCALRGAT